MVEAVGDGAGVQPGERVYAALFPAGGGFAELALASADRLAPMPGKANFVEAAGLVIGAGTAYEGLIDRGRLQAGETVLITAAAGGVGSAAVQIAGQPAWLEQLAALVDAGELRPQAETVLPLGQAREALARVAARHTRGKIALQIGRLCSIRPACLVIGSWRGVDEQGS